MAMGLDDDDDDDDDRQRKKVFLYLNALVPCSSLDIFQATRFDEDLDEHISAIELKYPTGTCATHPDQECFHHRPTDNHFELMHAQKIFWAAKIVSSFPFKESQ
jgi:hypothetical protein